MNVAPPSLHSYKEPAGPKRLWSSASRIHYGNVQYRRLPAPQSEELLLLCPGARPRAPVLCHPRLEHLSSTHRQCRSTHQRSQGQEYKTVLLLPDLWLQLLLRLGEVPLSLDTFTGSFPCPSVHSKIGILSSVSLTSTESRNTSHDSAASPLPSSIPTKCPKARRHKRPGYQNWMKKGENKGRQKKYLKRLSYHLISLPSLNPWRIFHSPVKKAPTP